MVNKRTTSTAKTKGTKKTPSKINNKRTTSSASRRKTVVKSAPKTVHQTEPFHPAFGIVLLVVCCIMAAFLIAGGACYIIKQSSDPIRFSKEYSLVDGDNVFVYTTEDNAVKILEDGTGIVFLGYPECPWCQYYAKLLNDMAKEYGIDKIYYLNTYDGWKNNSEGYQKLTEILSSNLQFDNVGKRHLYVPDSAFVINGEIIGNDWETSKDTLGLTKPEDYWTEERVAAWKEKVTPLFKQIKETKE